MRLNPKNVTELIGQSTELICRAQGSEIIYHWVKNDTRAAEQGGLGGL